MYLVDFDLSMILAELQNSTVYSLHTGNVWVDGARDDRCAPAISYFRRATRIHPRRWCHVANFRTTTSLLTNASDICSLHIAARISGIEPFQASGITGVGDVQKEYSPRCFFFLKKFEIDQMSPGL
jgi:hypothetical protein